MSTKTRPIILEIFGNLNGSYYEQPVVFGIAYEIPCSQILGDSEWS